jgi:hypothetical protein
MQYDDASSDVSNDVCRTQYDDVSRDAGRTQDDDVSNDAWPDVGRKFDESRTGVGRTKVGWTSDGRLTKVGRAELSRRCGDGGQRRYTVAPRNAAAMAGSNATRSVGRQRTAACSVLPALLQQRAGPRSVAAMADNALDLAACCCDVR